MTRNSYKSGADKALWERVRASINAQNGKTGARELDAKTANLIAGYLAGTLSAAEHRTLVRRLNRRPEYLDVLLSARSVADMGEIEAPQSLRALARHVVPATSGAGRRSGSALAFAPRPVLGWIAASLIAIALAIGGFFLGQQAGGPVADHSAQNNPTMADDLDVGSDPDLSETENGLFDALDLDF